MYKFKNTLIVLLAMVLTVVTSCRDLDELNINPNGPDPATTDLNLLLPTIIVDVGQTVVDLGFGDMAGVMQHTQKDGWSSSHNDYDWDSSSKSWSRYYGILRNADEYHKKAVEDGYTFHEGVGLILKAWTFGMITDLWGDAPFTDALKANEGPEYYEPAYSSQEDIYKSILADLESANELLSGNQEDFKNIDTDQDVLFAGNALKWRKLANSLALRYHMRLSEKAKAIAEGGITNITSNPDKYPLITDFEDDASVSYPGSVSSDSWPTNTVFDISTSGDYLRVKMCATFVETLQGLNDPRLGVWANKVEIPLQLVAGEEIDQIVEVDGKEVRQISQDIVDAYIENVGVEIDYDTEYIGIPTSIFGASFYNLNPNLYQGTYNPHCSQLNDIYQETTGDLLLMRIASASEVNFLLAEAAEYGWASGNAEDYFKEGIKQSFIAWGVEDQLEEYMQAVSYAGLESLITQKWIASWTAAAEAWFDYRRTGYPDLQTGESAMREKLPLRFPYHFEDEISRNSKNAKAAIDQLEVAIPGIDEGKNGAWSKSWLLQGTNKPY